MREVGHALDKCVSVVVAVLGVGWGPGEYYGVRRGVWGEGGGHVVTRVGGALGGGPNDHTCEVQGGRKVSDVHDSVFLPTLVPQEWVHAFIGVRNLNQTRQHKLTRHGDLQDINTHTCLHTLIRGGTDMRSHSARQGVRQTAYRHEATWRRAHDDHVEVVDVPGRKSHNAHITITSK